MSTAVWLARLIYKADQQSAEPTLELRRPATRQPEPPIGFVRRSDPAYYYLVRQHQG